MQCFIPHCFVCRPSDSAVSEDAGIEPKTVATSASVVRRQKYKTLLKLVKNLVDIQIYHSLSFLYSTYRLILNCTNMHSVCFSYVWKGICTITPPPLPHPPPRVKVRTEQTLLPFNRICSSSLFFYWSNMVMFDLKETVARDQNGFKY